MEWNLNRMGAMGLLLFALTLWSCAKPTPYYGYPGPRLPAAETALLTPDAGVEIHSLNGEIVNIRQGPQSIPLLTTLNNCAVLHPGLYQLVLVPQDIQSAKTFTTVQADLSAGRQYRVRIRQITDSGAQAAGYEFWVENTVSGEVVSDKAISQNPFHR
jgi:hypothetical protein